VYSRIRAAFVPEGPATVEGGGVMRIARLVDVPPVTVLHYLELAGRARVFFFPMRTVAT
jgi:hypothetical protein